MKVLYMLIVVTVLSGCVGWSKANTAMEVAFVTEQTIDYRQTTQAISYGAEANPAIGAWGQNISPQAYFLTTTLLHVAIASVLPRYWREAFQGASLVDQTINVYGNVARLKSGNDCPAAIGTPSQCFPNP